MKNKFLEGYKKTDIYKIKLLKELLIVHSEDSFLVNKEERENRLFLKKYDDKYNMFISANDIYNEFKKIDNKLYKHNDYQIKIMLLIMEEYTKDRYTSFKNIYDKKYKGHPKTIKEYLDKFETTLYKVLQKLNINYYERGFTKREQKKTIEHLGETYLYLLSIGKWKLAEEILEVYDEKNLQKPKQQREVISKQIEIHTKIMAKECNILKKEAIEYLKKSTKKIKNKYLKSLN